MLCPSLARDDILAEAKGYWFAIARVYVAGNTGATLDDCFQNMLSFDRIERILGVNGEDYVVFPAECGGHRT